MKENVKLYDEVETLTLDLSKFTKGNLDKLLGNQKLSNDNTSLGFEWTSSKKVKEGKPCSGKAQVNVTDDCIGKALKNVIQIRKISVVRQANSSDHDFQKMKRETMLLQECETLFWSKKV